jgi:hypothetical protein
MGYRNSVNHFSATLVPPDEHAVLWPRLDVVIPQFPTYRERTDRDIRMFRLHPHPRRDGRDG